MKTVKETHRENNGTGLGGFTRTATSRNESTSKGPHANGGSRTAPSPGSRGVGFHGSPNKATPSMSFSVPTKSDMPKAGAR